MLPIESYANGCGVSTVRLYRLLYDLYNNTGSQAKACEPVLLQRVEKLVGR